MMRYVLPVLLLLAACQDERPPAPTAAESAALDDAETMLDELADDDGLANAEGPESSTAESD